MADNLLDRIFPFKRNWLELEDFRIHYVDEGQGRPVVMFHACPMWSFAYRFLIRELAFDHRVIAFDLPGFGLSSGGEHFDYTLNGYINVTESLLEHLQIDNATLILHGWGGTVGVGYAVRHPQRVSSLVILNTLAFSSYSIPWRLRLCRIPWLGAKLVTDLRLLQFGNRAVHARDIAAAYEYPYRRREARQALYRFVEDIPTVPEAESAQRMMEIETGLWMFRGTPSLILWAMRDWLYPPRLLKRWRRYLPNAEIHTIDRAGRYIQEDAPDELNRYIRAFFARHQL